MREDPRDDEASPSSADPLAATDEQRDPVVTRDEARARDEAVTEAGGRTGEDEDPGASAADSTRIGRYRLVRKLGEGGMGIVHLAHDDQLDRSVAIKILRPDGEGDPKRLLREARSMARLAHPHIAAVYDVGTHGGDVYVAMEYVQGPSLRVWGRGVPPWPARADVLLQAARGLAAAHASGVVHRDFKPDNVIVGDDGRVRVLDFGLAKLAPRTTARGADTTETQVGSIVGTPRYMAPEQLRTKAAGVAADQFSFCVTAYEVAYGRRPFDGDVFADVVVSVLTKPPHDPPPDSDVPAAVWPVLRKGMAVDEEQRYPSMTALIDALQAAVGSTQAPTSLAVATASAARQSRPAQREAQQAVLEAQEAARSRLTTAYAEDLLDSEEIDERLERLESAIDLAAVAALVADLAPPERAPVPAATPPETALAVRGAATPAVLDVPEHSRTIAVFSGNSRRGGWVPARRNKVIAVFGGAEIDLREAQIDGEIEIQVRTMFGGVEIFVPPGVNVQMDCIAIFGGTEFEEPSERPPPGAPVVRITGWVLFGGVEVVERLPGEGGFAAWRRRRRARKALRRAAETKALPPKR